MRDNFLSSLHDLASENKDVVLLTGDLGFGVFENFAKSFPGQYFNIGVAEQNMAGIAAGMAIEGKVVFMYSIGNFPRYLSNILKVPDPRSRKMKGSSNSASTETASLPAH